MRLPPNENSLSSEYRKNSTKDANRKLWIRPPLPDNIIRFKPEKTASTRFKEKLSQVGCVMFDANRVQIAQNLLLKNALLRVENTSLGSLKDENRVVSLNKIIQKIDADLSMFKQRTDTLQYLSVTIKKQTEIEKYDEELFEVLSFLLVEVKTSVKTFWQDIEKYTGANHA